MFRYLLLFVAVYLGFLALLFVKQRSLIFQPDNSLLNIESIDWLVTPEAWPSNENRHGFVITPDNPQGTVIVFHGNAGQALHRAYYANALAALGYRVVLAEYPGYGGRTGTPSEEALVSSGRQLISQIANDFQQSPIHLLGESMGSGVVSAIVADNWQPTPRTSVVSVILITPFDSLAAVAQTHYWYTPAKWLVRDKFDSIKNLGSFNGMKQIILAERDSVVPIKHGEKLYSQLSTPKQRYLIEGANHNNWIGQVDSQWWQKILSTANSK